MVSGSSAVFQMDFWGRTLSGSRNDDPDPKRQPERRLVRRDKAAITLLLEASAPLLSPSALPFTW
jgi:hypothetical protein